MQGYVTTAELAAHLGVTSSAVAQRVRTGSLEPLGKLPGIRGAYIFAPDVLENAPAKGCRS